MKSKKRALPIFLVAVLALTSFAFPLTAGAADKVEDVKLPVPKEVEVPPMSDLSDDPNFSEGFTSSFSLESAKVLSSKSSSVSGSCNIGKTSSSSVNVSGSSTCYPADPSLRVTTYLQAYHNGSWQTVATKTKNAYSTSVYISQAYNVTSGYYYRVKAYHSMSTGDYAYTYTGGVLVN